MKERIKQNKGITLVALVITIIVLLILAGVTINLTLGENGIFKMAEKAGKNYTEAQDKELQSLADLEDYLGRIVVSEEGYSTEYGVNKPKLKPGMIPVYYDDTSKVWKKADENNTGKQWYDYDTKKWANIVTVADENKNLREVAVGTEIPMDKITTFFVWIPRYAYSIESGYKQGEGATGRIDVTFLKGNTNKGADGTEYPTNYDESKLAPGNKTPKIVHPGFTLESGEVTGIWVAKFEASGINKDGVAAGNASNTSSTPTSAEGAYVKILPSQISWRHITIGESEYQSMRMSENTGKYGWTSDVNSHLIKNNEWGAVAYLCYSKYGSTPKTNGSGSYNSTIKYYYNMYTGAGAKSTTDEGRYENFTEGTYGYNTTNGKLASTTGNVYGIYDMAGGAWDRVAGYLENGNSNLNTYGKSTSNGEIKYFENGVLNSKYSSLWNSYEVSEEEKSNKIKVTGVGEISQNTLWNWSNKSQAYNEARLRLTKANFENMSKYKGIGVNETTTKFSYFAPYGTDSSNQNWGWFTEAKDTSTNTTQDLAKTWNSDYTLIGHASSPFVMRGGTCIYGSSAGVLYSNFTAGSAHSYYGFRPALAF